VDVTESETIYKIGSSCELLYTLVVGYKEIKKILG
jgi:hypothetical protein